MKSPFGSRPTSVSKPVINRIESASSDAQSRPASSRAPIPSSTASNIDSRPTSSRDPLRSMSMPVGSRPVSGREGISLPEEQPSICRLDSIEENPTPVMEAAVTPVSSMKKITPSSSANPSPASTIKGTSLQKRASLPSIPTAGLNVTAEDAVFRLPENQLTEVVRPRNIRQTELDAAYANVLAGSAAYAQTCTREFSRDFTVISIGHDMPTEIQMEVYDGSNSQNIKYPEADDIPDGSHDHKKLDDFSSKDFKSRRILNHYHPGYSSWSSTFKTSPFDLPNLLSNNLSTSNHIYFNVTSCGSRQHFEPLFGSFILYASNGHQLIRLTETFYFDATIDSVRERFPDRYASGRKDRRLASEILGCVFSVPEEPVFAKNQSFYLVFQIHKVITADTDAMVANYTRGTAPKAQALMEAHSRLGKFHAPIAFGFCRFNEDAESAYATSHSLTVKTHPIRSPLTDTALAQFIHVGGLTEFTDIEVKFNLKSVGTDEQLQANITSTSNRPDASLRIFPAQVYTADPDKAHGWFENVVDVKKLLPIPPHPSVATTEDNIKRMLSFFDNTLFVYPQLCDKFYHRNLTIRVQLVVFNKGFTPLNFGSNIPESQFTILTSVYNEFHRPFFVSEAFTKVAYHNQSPPLNDEVKIRLPADLNKDFALRVTAFHVHVQLKAKEKTLVEIGSSFLCLISPEGALIEDKDYVLALTPTLECLEDIKSRSSIFGRDGGTQTPTVRLRTRSLSSMYSTCPRIHAFLTTLLSYPLLPTESHVKQGSIPSESALDTITFDLHNASVNETSKHFFVIFRQLATVICGGTRVYSAEFMNPYNHPQSRCAAFLSILQVFSKIAPNASIEVNEEADDVEDRSTGEEFLRNYMDFIFVDEDLAQLSDLPKRPPIPPRFAEEANIVDFVFRQLEEILLEDAILRAVKDPKNVFLDIVGGVKPSFIEKYCDKAWLEMPARLDKDHAEFANVFSRLQSTVCSPAVLASEGSFQLAPIQPKYDRLDGFLARQSQVASSGSKTHWQPWLYEVFVNQWCAVLMALQKASPLAASIQLSDEARIPYPDIFVQRIQEFSSSPKKDVRALLLGHGPLVLKIISKSLAFRISREGKRSPVVVDDTFLRSLETLVELLSAEVLICLTNGPWRSRKLNTSLAQFLRGLFAMVAPVQVQRLVGAYFKRQITRRDEVDLRIEFLDELSQYDQFVAINFPLPLYANLSYFDGKNEDSYLPSIRGIELPASGWLVQLMVREISAIKVEEKRTMTLAVGMLRDLLVRLSFDTRYQSIDHAHRVATLFLPLIGFILAEESVLMDFKVDALHRKEVVAILLYLVQTLPEKHLRAQLRQIARATNTTTILRSNTNSLLRISDFSILRVLKLLHIAVDTFDLPWDFSTTLDHSHKALVPSGAAVFDGSIPANAFANLAQLDQLMHVRSGVHSIVRKGRKSNGTAEERKWKAHVTDMVLSVDDKKINRLFTQCEMSQGQLAARGMCHESALLVLKTVTLLLDEMPKLLYDKKKDDFEDPYKEVMSLSVGALLHLLMNNESELVIAFTLQTTAYFLRRFGGRLFFIAADDSLQDWVRAVLEYCGSRSALVRTEAISLLILLFQSTFHFTGSVSKLSDTILAICSDLIYDVVYNKLNSATTREKFLPNLNDSFNRITADCASRFVRSACPPYPAELSASLSSAVIHLMERLLKVVTATKYVFILMPKITIGVRNRRSMNVGPLAEMLDSNISVQRNNTGGTRLPVPSTATDAGARRSTLDTLTVRQPIPSVTTASSEDPLGPSPKGVVKKAASKDYADMFRITSTALKTPVSTLTLDPALKKSATADSSYSPTMQGVPRKSSLEGSPPPSPPPGLRNGREFVNIDQEYVLDLFLEVISFFDPVVLPRTRINWLENLIRVHELDQNKAEIAEIQWRIYLVYEKVKPTWESTWAARERVPWSKCRGYEDLSASARNFLAVMTYALQHQGRCWLNDFEFQESMEKHLLHSMNAYLDIGLINLAERANRKVIELLLSTGKVTRSVAQYQDFSSKLGGASDISVALGLGLYYRVWYIGKKVPDSLRSNEYIYRNSKSLHLSDFGSSLNKQLAKLIGDVNISVVLDTTKIPSDDFPDAAIVIMSVKPLKMEDASNEVVSRNQARVFQHSVPFTKDGSAHARSIDQQWKRITYFEVEDPFPYLVYRQKIISKTVKELEPIEVAIDDVSIRNEAMLSELNKDKRDGGDTQNMMRIIQGSVMPQVNGGVLEVAKVFLGADDGEGGGSTRFKATFVATLQHHIVDFLMCSKQLLDKANKILIIDAKLTLLSTEGVDTDDPAARAAVIRKRQQEYENHVIWMKEMDRGFETLIRAMSMYLVGVQGFGAIENAMNRPRN